MTAWDLLKSIDKHKASEKLKKAWKRSMQQSSLEDLPELLLTIVPVIPYKMPIIAFYRPGNIYVHCLLTAKSSAGVITICAGSRLRSITACKASDGPSANAWNRVMYMCLWSFFVCKTMYWWQCLCSCKQLLLGRANNVEGATLQACQCHHWLQFYIWDLPHAEVRELEACTVH